METEMTDKEKQVRITNIQDTFLNNARKEKTPIVIFLMNGFQMRGLVRSFDNYVIILDSDGKQNMIYKHAVSTVSPA